MEPSVKLIVWQALKSKQPYSFELHGDKWAEFLYIMI